jgi:hypothetical protein
VGEFAPGVLPRSHHNGGTWRVAAVLRGRSRASIRVLHRHAVLLRGLGLDAAVLLDAAHPGTPQPDCPT